MRPRFSLRTLCAGVSGFPRRPLLSLRPWRASLPSFSFRPLHLRPGKHRWVGNIHGLLRLVDCRAQVGLALRIQTDAVPLGVVSVSDPGVQCPVRHSRKFFGQLLHLGGDTTPFQQVFSQGGGLLLVTDGGLQLQDTGGQVQRPAVVHDVDAVADPDALRQVVDLYLIVDLHLPELFQLFNGLAAQGRLAGGVIGVLPDVVPLPVDASATSQAYRLHCATACRDFSSFPST